MLPIIFSRWLYGCRQPTTGDIMKVIMGGIIKHSKGYGFKLTFPSPETANKYKDMIRYILTSDNIPLIYNTGYQRDQNDYHRLNSYFHALEQNKFLEEDLNRLGTSLEEENK